MNAVEQSKECGESELVSGGSEQISGQMNAVEQSKECGESELVCGESEQTSGHMNGLVVYALIPVSMYHSSHSHSHSHTD